jgi:hypothetical protein
MSFDEFWQRYPRKVAKGDARKAWEKLKPTPTLEAQIFAALDWQREQWEDPRYTPHPATYLRGERWEDEPPAGRQRQLGDWRFECQALHGGRCTNVHFHEAMKERSA